MRPARDHRPRPDRRRGHAPTSSSATSRATSCTIGVDGAASPSSRRCCASQPFVREAAHDDGAVRLYVDDGEAGLPLVLRLLDGPASPRPMLALHRPSLDDVFLRQTGRSLRDTAA